MSSYLDSINQSYRQHEVMAQRAMAQGNPAVAHAAHKVMQQLVAQRDAAVSGGGGGGGGGYTGPSQAEILRRMEEERKQAEINRALQAAKSFIANNGLEELWAGYEKYIRQGYTNMETVSSIVSTDKAYQDAYYKRFPAVKLIREENQKRKEQGLALIAEPSMDTYVKLERSYREALDGLPEELYGTPDDIATFIFEDVSPDEVMERVTLARDYINYSVNPYVKEELRSIYGMTDDEMVTYVLDPERSEQYLKTQYDTRLKQANVGGAADSQGINLSSEQRDLIAGNEIYGNSFGNSATQFATIAEEKDDYAKLGELSGINTNTGELVSDKFNLPGNEQAVKKKKRLASAERARFGGRSGVGSNALSAGRKAQ